MYEVTEQEALDILERNGWGVSSPDEFGYRGVVITSDNNNDDIILYDYVRDPLSKNLPKFLRQLIRWAERHVYSDNEDKQETQTILDYAKSTLKDLE